MIWVGGVCMVPLSAQIMHITKTVHTTDREIHYIYGACAFNKESYPLVMDIILLVY